uniref:TMV resistance protein N n=1 Tax=Tanacetum cinerariifolium TaxID=118510 RepID=A0A699I4X9_TANCI|nr:TMV resistance protein N [Tanacetum cinerariifolium]
MGPWNPTACFKKIRFFNRRESLELFTRLTYEQDDIVDKKLVKEIVCCAGGLRLVLEVWSRHFKLHEREQRLDLLETLKIIPPDDVQKKLQISYDSLNKRAQKLFLDIACFFDGMYKDLVVKLLLNKKTVFFLAIQIRDLVDKGLVKRKALLLMHHVIRDMGKEIVRQESEDEPRRRSRLRDHRDVLHVVRLENCKLEILWEGFKVLSGKTASWKLVPSNPANVFKSKLQQVKATLKQWRKNVVEKENLVSMDLRNKIDELDMKAETSYYSTVEVESRTTLVKSLANIKYEKVNDLKQKAKTRWGLGRLCQGDPLSPFLFILVAQALNVAILEATNHNIFHGIKVGKDKLHISHLQYANDALILGEWSLTNAKNLSRILTCFHLAFGLKVNFNKNKLYGIGVSNLELNSIATSIGCLASQFLCTYLGLPIGVDMSRDTVISPHQKRGLGISSLLAKNQSMLLKWWWRFRTEENALWCKVICSIHGPSGGMYHSSSHPLSSGTWSRICNLKNDLSNFRIELPRLFKKKAGNGRNTSFWHDNWIGGATLQDSFRRLYRLEIEKSCLVCDRYDAALLSDQVLILPKLKKPFDVAVNTTLWHLWNFRNNAMLLFKYPRKELILNDIKLSSFSWFLSRNKKASLNWRVV